MKKRRELDALVTNEKVRRKAKTGHELLRSNGETESSDVDEFNVACRKSSMSKRGRGSLCSTCSSLLGFLLVVACLLACAGLIWMHFELKQSIDNIREQLRTISLASQSSLEDYQKLYSQLHEMNKTINNLRTGKSGVETLDRNITELSEKIQKLTEETNKVKTGLEEAPELKQLPAVISTLSKSIASLGSDLQTETKAVSSLTTFRDTTKNTLQQLTTELDEIKAKIMSTSSAQSSKPNPTMKEEIFLPVKGQDQLTEIQQKITNIEMKLHSVNSSLISRISDMQSAMLEHGFRTAALENTTNTMLADIDLLTLDHAGEDNGMKTGNMEATVKNIVEKMLKNTSSTEEPKLSEVPGFESYKQSAGVNIQHLNESYVALHEDFENLISKVDLNKKQLFIMKHQISGLQRYLATIGYSEGEENLNTSDTNSPPKTASKPVPLSKVDLDKGEENLKASDNTGMPSTTSRPVLHIADIDNAEDLKLNFERWNLNGNDKVSYEDMLDYRPSSQLPSKKELDQYDEDKDGFYSQQELMTALGFALSP